jgi:hypothetical protein
MCEPTTIAVVASTALSVGSSIANHSAQAKGAKENEKAARKAAKLNSAELSRRAVQETIASTAQANAIRRQSLSARGTLAASLAAGGLTGATADALDSEYLFAEDAAVQNTGRSLAWATESINYQQVSEYAQMRQRIAQAPPPNPLATGLSIAGQLANGYNTYRSANQQAPTSAMPNAPQGNVLAAPRTVPVALPNGLTLPGLPLMTPNVPTP